MTSLCPHFYNPGVCPICARNKEIAELKAKLAGKQADLKTYITVADNRALAIDELNLKLLAATVENEKLRAFALSVIDEYKWVERPAIFLEAKRREAEEVLKASHVSTIAAEQLREALRAAKKYQDIYSNVKKYEEYEDEVTELAAGDAYNALVDALSHPSVKEFFG